MIVLFTVVAVLVLALILTSKHQSNNVFNIADVKDIDLLKGEIWINIGYLAHPAHEDAFIAIFEKVFLFNKNTIKEFKYIEIRGNRMEVDSVYEQLKEIATELYNLREERVTLKLGSEAKNADLIIGFDDPYFLLKK